MKRFTKLLTIIMISLMTVTATGLVKGSNGSTTIIDQGITGNKKVIANWSPVNYTITYNLDGGSVSGNPTTYNYGTASFTLKNPTKTGYSFTGWTGSNGTTAQTTVTVAKGSYGNKSYTANWGANKYTVSFNANGGSGTMADETFTYDEEKNITKNTFSRTGYIFAGWSTSASDSTVKYTDKASVKNLTTENGGNIDLYAVWKSISIIDKTKFVNHGFSSSATSLKRVYEDPGIVIKVAENEVQQDGSGFPIYAWLDSSDNNNLKFFSDAEYIGLPVDSSKLFNGYNKLVSADFNGFSTSNVTDMYGMFTGSKIQTLDLSNFNTSNVIDMGSMFRGCSGLTSLDVSNFDTANVMDMCGMFVGCSSLTSLDLSSFNTQSVTNMSSMFSGCSSLTSLDLSSFNTSNVTKMRLMFYGCSGLTALNVSNFNTSNVTNMSSMFSDCSSLTSLDLSKFNTSNVTNMGSMFYGCSGLTALNVSNFNTSNVTNMGWMFNDCSGITSLDLSSFDTSKATYMSDIFKNCSNLTVLYGDKFDTQKAGTYIGVTYQHV